MTGGQLWKLEVHMVHLWRQLEENLEIYEHTRSQIFTQCREHYLNFFALCEHCGSPHFKVRHDGFDLLSAWRDSKGIMQTLCSTLCVGQGTRNPRTCAGAVVVTLCVKLSFRGCFSRCSTVSCPMQGFWSSSHQRISKRVYLCTHSLSNSLSHSQLWVLRFSLVYIVSALSYLPRVRTSDPRCPPALLFFIHCI
jgi:hypothetical protein